jgi:hypothetical protein
VKPVRTGSDRSVEILHELTDARIRAVGGSRASRAVSDLGWQRAQSYGIQRDDFRTVWHAGHVSALLTNDVDVIAATQTGGVWLLNKTVGPTALAGYTGIPLSDAWDSPDISCLAWSPERTRVYVGMSAQAIFLLEFETVLGGHLTLKQSMILPVPFSSANAIVTLSHPDRIVVATNSGVWWSPIPQPATKVAGYNWQVGQGLPGAKYSSLAVGPSASLAVAGYDSGVSLTIGGPKLGVGIYRGTFQGNVLVFAESKIEGVDRTLMHKTSLASCEDQPDRMYAVAEGADGMILAVLSSRDGGAKWDTSQVPNRVLAGNQGGFHQCLAVSPQRPDLVVIGWKASGPFWSEDGAQSWHQRHKPEAEVHLHPDLHALYLVRNPGGPEPLYVGGDGGIVVTTDLGQTYHSQFNRPLNNLQFYGGGRPTYLGTYGGSLTASSRYPGLLAGGTQDNGNVYRCPDRHREGVPRQADSPWLKHVGGDGDLTRFVDPLGVLLDFSSGDASLPKNPGARLHMAFWDEANNRFPAGEVISADTDSSGVAPTSVEVVQNPAFRKDGQLMYAAVGSTAEGLIHGLFADDPIIGRPDARNIRLIRLGLVGGVVTAIASIDGSTLMIGTDSGRIISFDSASGSINMQYALPDVATGVVSRIEVFPPPSTLGSLPDNALALVDGRILHFNGLFWATTTGTDWTTFARDSQSGRLFAATDGDVFLSEDNGKSWIDASAGLPVRPHCTDLRVADDGVGGRDLYLATYGHSVWRATIDQRSPIFDLPPEAVQILYGIIEDGGGIVRLGKHFMKLPPRPLIRDLLAALVIDNVAQSMSKESVANSRAIRRAALQQIAEIALREVGQLG